MHNEKTNIETHEDEKVEQKNTNQMALTQTQHTLVAYQERRNSSSRTSPLEKVSIVNRPTG
jgi:hypothetical protein